MNMIRKKFTKHGNSRALVFDKPLLDLLRWDDDIEVTITTDGRNFIISPVSDDNGDEDDKAFQQVARLGMQKHKESFKKLAEL